MRLIFYITSNFRRIPRFEAKLKSFDCNSLQVQVYIAPQLTKLYRGESIGVQF